jgi:hypothetical protein
MNLSQLLSTLFAALKNQIVLAAAPDLITFLGNTAKLDVLSVPGQIAYVAQLDLLRSSLAASLTSLAPSEFTAINTAISNELQAAIQKAEAAAQAAASPPVAAPPA